jgi:hypothetical protein
MRENINAYKFLILKSVGMRTVRKAGVNEKIMLKSILKVYDGRVLTGFIWLGLRASGEFL